MTKEERIAEDISRQLAKDEEFERLSDEEKDKAIEALNKILIGHVLRRIS